MGSTESTKLNKRSSALSLATFARFAFMNRHVMMMSVVK